MTYQQTASALRDQLVTHLLLNGHRISATWTLDGVRDVARHLVLPCVYTELDGGKYAALHPDDPAWLPATYANAPLVVQLDGTDGRWIEALDAPVTGTPTAVAIPSAKLVRMLEALDVYDDEEQQGRVLVAGANDAYLAALLAYRVGEWNVHVVEPNLDLARLTGQALQRLGYAPQIVHGALADGHISDAPYTQVVAAAPVSRIPAAWIAQSRPGEGMIGAQLDLPLASDPIVQLTVGTDGTAHGHFLPHLSGHPRPGSQVDLAQFGIRLDMRPGQERRTTALTEPLAPGLRVVAALMMRDVAYLEEGLHRWLVDLAAPSRDRVWARCDTSAGTVVQHGPRRLWDALEQAHEVWQLAGCPAPDQIGCTIHANGEREYWLEIGTPLWSDCGGG